MAFPAECATGGALDGELERQRSETDDGIPVRDEADAVPVRAERSVGESSSQRKAAAYDADDLEIPSFLRRR